MYKVLFLFCALVLGCSADSSSLKIEEVQGTVTPIGKLRITFMVTDNNGNYTSVNGKAVFDVLDRQGIVRCSKTYDVRDTDFGSAVPQASTQPMVVWEEEQPACPELFDGRWAHSVRMALKIGNKTYRAKGPMK